ncbi:hypothetical protein IMAU10031_00853 [Lactobacillus helveticus]|nr:hypothetical protein [Lactobacillus helveticus]NRO75991.1 hypothetical protein [Lactobacillus helveticus]
MFKSTKSQFAIRKLTQGAVAVLLTFGIFANTTSGIVSAAVNESSDVNTGIITIIIFNTLIVV